MPYYYSCHAAKRRFLDSKLQSLIAASLDIDSFPKFLLDAMEKRDVQKRLSLMFQPSCLQPVIFFENSTLLIFDYLCSKYNIADGMRQMFDPFERVARAHHICPCCERPFSPNEEDEFVQKVREHITVLKMHGDLTFRPY